MGPPAGCGCEIMAEAARAINAVNRPVDRIDNAKRAG